jgi:hypothetical protein
MLPCVGVRLDQTSQCGGHSSARTFRTKEEELKATNIGWNIISTLKQTVEANLNVSYSNVTQHAVSSSNDTYINPVALLIQ